MDGLTNYNGNSALAKLASLAPQNVLGAIRSASRESGVDFAYLLQQAKAESSFRADAKAKTSSARGLYQFIESTWLAMVEKHGARYGIETAGKSREEILALRDDPEKASFMAAALASDNRKFLNAHWGGDAGPTELYFAHFMGAGGAAAFLKARDENPLQKAADLFPKAAKANRNVFYEPASGRARSLEEVYRFFDRKFSLDGPVEPAAPVAIAATPRPSLNSLYQTAGTPQRPGRYGYGGLPLASLIVSPVELMLISQLDVPHGSKRNF